MNPSHARGRAGERLAARFFQLGGYQIVERNWRCPPLGELDLIVRRGRELLFVEVKTSNRSDFDPSIYVDATKEKRLYRLAQAYIALHGWAAACRPRIDVVAVFQQRGRWELVHYPGAVEG